MAKKRTKRTVLQRSGPDWTKPFLAHLADSGNIRAACRMAGIGKSAVYQRRDGDHEFADAMREALEDAIDDLEVEARRRAKDGVKEYVLHQGEVVRVYVDANGEIVDSPAASAKRIALVITKYSDRLLMFLLQAHRPGRFRDKSVKVEHSGEIKGDNREWQNAAIRSKEASDLVKSSIELAAAGDAKGSAAALEAAMMKLSGIDPRAWAGFEEDLKRNCLTPQDILEAERLLEAARGESVKRDLKPYAAAIREFAKEGGPNGLPDIPEMEK